MAERASLLTILKHPNELIRIESNNLVDVGVSEDPADFFRVKGKRNGYIDCDRFDHLFHPYRN